MAGSSHVPTGRAACCSLLPCCKSRANRALLHHQQLRGRQSQHSVHDSNQTQRVWETRGHQNRPQGDQEEVSACVEPPLLRCLPVLVAPVVLFRAQKIPQAGPGAPVQLPKVPVPGVGAQGGHHRQRSRIGEAFTQCSACSCLSLPIAEPSTCCL